MANPSPPPHSIKPLLYQPMPRWHWWAAMGGALAIHLTAVLFAQRREPPPMDLSEIPTATVEATLQPEEQPTPPPEEVITPPPPEPEATPEFREETTPPPRQPKQTKIVPIKAPVVGRAGPMSISSAKAVATYAPRPPYPYEARSRKITGSGVCVVTVDLGSGSVTSAVMAQSIGNVILDNAATNTFKNWKFRPGAVSGKVKIPITFTMSGASY